MNEKENYSYNENITDEEEVYTSEWLKKNTEIHGWLSFFLFAIIAGSLVSLIYTIATINLAEYSYNYCLLSCDLFMVISYLGIAVYTVCLFITRKPNAFFYGVVYIVSVFLSNLLALIAGATEETGIFTSRHAVRSLIWGVIWFLYLLFSEQVKVVIPKSFRKIYKRDWGILASIIIIPIGMLFVGVLQISAIANKYSIQEEEIWAMPIAPNEYKDGRIIFAVPDGFTCESEDVVVEGTQISIFYLNNDEIGNCTICSDYDRDTSQSNFDSYWENWKDSNADLYPMDDIDRGTTTINGNTCVYRIVRYDYDGVYVYWRYYLLFNTKKEKVFVASCYDRNTSTSYIDELLSSVKF